VAIDEPRRRGRAPVAGPIYAALVVVLLLAAGWGGRSESGSRAVAAPPEKVAVPEVPRPAPVPEVAKTVWLDVNSKPEVRRSARRGSAGRHPAARRGAAHRVGLALGALTDYLEETARCAVSRLRALGDLKPAPKSKLKAAGGQEEEAAASTSDRRSSWQI